MPSASSHDRVTELYRGEIFTPETQRVCRERVHWICSLAKGPRVLDAGCSQGIVSILLASEGHHVVGVDLDESAIDFASEHAGELAPEVRARLDFRVADVFSIQPDEPPAFDTLICGEFLEHFANPELVLDHLLTLLSPDGQVIITVPFALHPHPDHRTTFVASRLARLIEGRLSVEHFEALDGYLRFVGTKGGMAGDPPGDSELLALTEVEMVERQRHLFSQLEARRKKLDGATGELGTAQAQLDQREEELRDSERRLDVLQRELGQEQASRKAIANELADARDEARRGLDESNERAARLEAKIEQMETAAIELESRLSEGAIELGERESRIEQVGAQLRELSGQLEETSDQLDDALAAQSLARDEHDSRVADLEAEHEARSAELRAEGARTAAELDRAETQLTELESRLGELRSEQARSSRARDKRISDLERELSSIRGSRRYRLVQRLLPDESGGRNAIFLPLRLLGMAWTIPAGRVKARMRPPLNGEPARQKLSELLSSGGPEAAEAWIAQMTERDPDSERSLTKLLFLLTKDSDPGRSIGYGERVLELDPGDEVIQQMVERRLGSGPEPGPESPSAPIDGGEAIEPDPQPEPLSFSGLRSALSERLTDGAAAAEEWGLAAVERGQTTEIQVYRILFSLLRREDPETAQRFGLRAFELSGDPKLGRALVSGLQGEGRIRESLALMRRICAEADAEERAELERSTSVIAGQVELLDHGFPPPAEAAGRYQPGERVIYLLHNSLPYVSGGYATRSHGLAKGVRGNGVDLEVVTRLGFPTDLSSVQLEGEPPTLEEVDGVPYRRLPSKDHGWGASPIPDYLRAYATAVIDRAGELKPGIVHGASSYVNGAVANYVGRELGIPSIYEVRGLWEITRVSRQPDWLGSDQFEMHRRMEASAAIDATAVIAITHALKREMVNRGVPEEKITVIPNGVDPDRFLPRERDRTMEQQLGVEGKTVIGYVGSVVDYEGLEDLIGAVAELRAREVSDFQAVIVGDGAVFESVKQRAADLGVLDLVHFAGRVPHDLVEDYYSVMDVIAYPRKPLPVCEMVSPMKPFEAMSMEKAVVSSDVDALAEIVEHGVNGLLHRKGDPDDLASKLALLIEDAELRQRLGEGARRYVVAERSWQKLTDSLVELYAQLQRDAGRVA